MANVSVSTGFGSLSTYVYTGAVLGAYDQTKLGLGPLMMQANDTGNEGKWVGPMPPSVMRPVETSLQMPGIIPDSITWSPTYDWVVCADNAAVSATRRFELFTFNKTVRTNPWSFVGAIVCTIPSQGTQGTYSNYGNRVVYNTYTVGTGTITATLNSPTVTGTGTAWSANRIFAGSRIGFGTTDPTLVSTWYEISAVGSDTSITLTTNYLGTTIPGNGSYVIEDLRILFVMRNGVTVANAGLFMAAGLRPELFTPAGSAVIAGVTTDKIRAVYWLGDGGAASNSNCQTYCGIAVDDKVDWTHQNVYCYDGPASTARIQVNNFRSALTLSAGRDTASFVFNTGAQPVSGAGGIRDLVICTPGAGGGPRQGVKSLFFCTAVRIYSAAVANLYNGSLYWLSGAGIENPPGSTTTFAAAGTMNSISYDPLSDRFFIFTTSAAANRHYMTQYREDAGQLDRIILPDTRQLNQSTEDSTAAIVPTTLTGFVTGDVNNGILYYSTGGPAGTGITAVTNFLFAAPFGADWEYASVSNCRIVLPVMNTSAFSSFVAAYTNVIEVIGGPTNYTLGRTGTNLGQEPGAVRMYYRTSGISDNTGTWNLLDYSGSLSGVQIATQIQFMLEFRMANSAAFGARVTRVCVEGAGATSDSHFQFSQKNSSLAAKQFSWRYCTAFGTAVPTLYIRIYDAVTGNLLVTDNSVSQVGQWEKCTDGSTFGAFDTVDRANETTYLRYTPYSIADNIDALPVLGLS